MDVEQALILVDSSIFTQTGKHLNTLQMAIVRGVWNEQKYEEIAEQNYCSQANVKLVASNLWELLSEAVAEKSRKKFAAVLERRANLIPPQPLVTQSEKVIPHASSLAIADPEFPEGQVELTSKFYVERSPIEARCYETIVKAGSLIRIKAPQQMGKTSLLARISHFAQQQDYRTATVSFQLADSRIFEDLDSLLQWFTAIIGLKLKLPNRIADYWDKFFGSKTSCQNYFEDYLLAQLDSPLVLGLDAVDRVFQYRAIADDFFSLLRAFYEEAKGSEIWKKLRMVVVHSTEVYIPLNINQSPFNVGLPIELPEFNPEQVHDLAKRHGLNWTETEVKSLMELIGGHPYLLRVALYHMARGEIALKQLKQLATTETSPYRDHLRRHLSILQQQPELAIALKTIVTDDRSIRLESILLFKLYSMGLIHLQGNDVTPRCQLYRQYFSDRL